MMMNMAVMSWSFDWCTIQWRRKKDVGSWDDEFETFESLGILDVANLFFDEPELEAVVFVDEDESEIIEVGSTSN